MAAYGVESPPDKGNTEDDARKKVVELPEMIEHIVKHLPMKSLNVCARVNWQWHDAAQKAKSHRQQMAWLWYDASSGSSDVDDAIADPVEWLACEPQTAFVFCSNSLHEASVSVPSYSTAVTSRHPRAAKQERMPLVQYLNRVLPPSCCIRGVTTDGVVGMPKSGHRAIELENSKAASCLLLPHIDGVDVYSFAAGQIIDRELKGFSATIITPKPEPDAMRTITGIPSDKKARVVLLFHVEPFYNLDSDLGYALLQQYGQVVVAGGHVDELLPEVPLSDTEQDEPLIMGLAFCGENIKMASVLLRNSCKSKSAVETQLKKLQNAHVPSTNRIGFMFACVGRGQHFYRDSNVESEVFHKLFPDTPLFGFFGNGEVGYDYLPDYACPEDAEKYSVVGVYEDEDAPYEWDLPDIHHSYTTVFVLMSLA